MATVKMIEDRKETSFKYLKKITEKRAEIETLLFSHAA